MNRDPAYYHSVSLIGLLFCVSAAFSAPRSWSGSVPGWAGPGTPISTGLNVDRREFVTVSVNGSVCTGDGAPWNGPGGTWYHETAAYAYTTGTVNLLLRRVDGSAVHENHIPIEGGQRAFVSPYPGSIYAYVNDDAPDDNQGVFTVTISIHPASTGDQDGDGLSDAMEDALLDFYAPELRFDADEDIRPCDAYCFLRVSKLRDDTNGSYPLTFYRAPFYPEWHLAQFTSKGVSTNILDSYASGRTSTNIDDDYRDGWDWARVRAADNVGLYGHVVQSAAGVIQVQYWQLFGFNDVDVTGPDIGEHEGDWELFEVFVPAADPFNVNAVLEMRWHAHGNTPAGAWWTAGHGWGWSSSAWSCSPIGSFPWPHSGPPWQHAPILIEAGTHGFYPTEWDCLAAGKNRGNWYSYVPPVVPNVGEIRRPRLFFETVLQFNGTWGEEENYAEPPHGPILQRWIDGGPTDEARYVGKWNHGRSHPNGLAPLGRISWPHQSVSSAVGNAASGQTILIFPGSYDASGVTITKAVTLRAPHGDVTIGQ